MRSVMRSHVIILRVARLLGLRYVSAMSDYQLRLAAAERGEKTYQGRECHQNHGGLRYTSNGVCVECMKAKSNERRDRVRELLKRNAT